MHSVETLLGKVWGRHLLPRVGDPFFVLSLGNPWHTPPGTMADGIFTNIEGVNDFLADSSPLTLLRIDYMKETKSNVFVFEMEGKDGEAWQVHLCPASKKVHNKREKSIFFHTRKAEAEGAGARGGSDLRGLFSK